VTSQLTAGDSCRSDRAALALAPALDDRAHAAAATALALDSALASARPAACGLLYRVACWCGSRLVGCGASPPREDGVQSLASASRPAPMSAATLAACAGCYASCL
jgi:hypothetical protein